MERGKRVNKSAGSKWWRKRRRRSHPSPPYHRRTTEMGEMWEVWKGVKSRGHYSFEQRACLERGNRFLAERTASLVSKMTLRECGFFFSIGRIRIVDRITRGFHHLWATLMSDSGLRTKDGLKMNSFSEEAQTGLRGSPCIVSFPLSQGRRTGQRKIGTVSREFK